MPLFLCFKKLYNYIQRKEECYNGKKGFEEKKQFFLETRNDYLYYLASIFVRLKGYQLHIIEELEEIKEITEDKEKKEKIAYSEYVKYQSRLSYLTNYCLNLVGDAQMTSLSYFKIRKLIDKKKNTLDFLKNISEMSKELSYILKRFNSSRNFSNHIPESILTSEREMLGDMYNNELFYSQIIIKTPKYCTIDYLYDLYRETKEINDEISEVLKAIKEDYNFIFGKEVNIVHLSDETPRGTDNLNMVAVKKASKIHKS